MSDLIYVSVNEPGYSRKKRGSGFQYLDEKGKRITDKEIISRIKALKIPPMWEDVWICKKPSGHLQATGIDSRRRKQYLYHEEWSKLRNESKFYKMAEFARALPVIRKTAEKDLNKDGWPREKVLALIINILDECFLRIGNKTYTEQNETYGLTTLRRKHLNINGSKTTFSYMAKGSKYRKVSIEGRKITRLIKECSQLPGYEVFQYRDNDGTVRPVYSSDVNTYLQEVSGESFTAKDFRTWGGTVTAIELFEKAKAEAEANPRKKLSTSLVKNVAERLGNTVAICQEYYIHPCILSKVIENSLDLEKAKNAALKKYKELHPALDDNELIALLLVEEHLKENEPPDLKILEKAAA